MENSQHSPVIGNPWKNILSFAVLDIYPLEDCQDVYSREYVTRKNFCAGFLSRGGGACNHDVGGPGIADGILMGIISFGSPVCGTPDAPTVFTKLGYYSDWVEEIMDMDVPVSKKRTTLKPIHDPLTARPLQTTKRPTTFKIPPLTGGEMNPVPISLIDNQLRIFDDNVFKDFLSTIFHSGDVSENRLVKDIKDSIELESTVNYGTKYNEDLTEKSKQAGYSEISSEDSGTKNKVVKDTLYNGKKIPISYDFDEEIEKLIENVNLGKKEEVQGIPMDVKNIPEFGDSKSVSDRIKSNNESVITLLYLSDDEKKDNIKNIVDDVYNENEGVGSVLRKRLDYIVQHYKFSSKRWRIFSCVVHC
ncbi:jg13831 [Pararge aegeria aegeria]|uniref:Jg13831 protein n=1 Tax=Pararge aegeria aegeria TaxID=348720 RepID=A0A8S4S621_9NEOP|nr:jg13831 [Pararge aegeria aegeria]